MKPISFAIQEIVSFLPGVKSAEELEKWLNNPSSSTQTDVVSFNRLIPAIISRRLDKGSLFAAEAAAKISEHDSPTYIIFSSRHGELAKGEKILTAINQGSEVSPADFSHSVHNSASGIFSIAKHITAPITSIAAGEDSFHCALIDAVAALEDGAQGVLVVDFENILPPLLGRSFPHAPQSFCYAIGILLKTGTEFSFSPSFSRNRATLLKSCHIQSSGYKLPSSLQFLRYSLLRYREFETFGGNSTFTWRRYE